ncbi:MAG: helix-hairpin-helix domain-containing protein [Pirellulaceae bacterium]
MSNPENKGLLHPNDQRVLLVFGILGMIGIGLYFFSLWIQTGQVIELDEATRFDNDYLVNVNSADWTELSNLPGVGPKLAQQIVVVRDEVGRFDQPADLLAVPGIGTQKLESFQNLLTGFSKPAFNPDIDSE